MSLARTDAEGTSVHRANVAATPRAAAWRAWRGFVRKEAYHLLRDRQTLAILLLMPLVQVLLFGFAIRTDVHGIRLVIVDPTPGPSSARLVERFRASEHFEVVAVLPAPEGLPPAFAAGEVRQAVVLPRDADRRLVGPAPLPVQVITDASDPNTGTIMASYAEQIVRRWWAEAGGAPAPVRIDAQVRMRFNPTLESVMLFVPGLIALVLTIVSAMMTAITIVREKETGTMEMLLVSPLRPSAIVLGKVAPYVVLGMVNVGLVLTAARLVFDVPVRGSLLLLLAACLLYTVTALALGIVISTRAATQRTAMLAALAGLLMPTILLSGFIFPLDSMPAPLRGLSHIIPARWFLLVVRGIMLKGAGLAELWQELLALTVLTAVLLTAGIRKLAIRLA
jgi:ABC-2 type transport system permease protein